MRNKVWRNLGILVLVCVFLSGGLAAGGATLAQTGAGVGDRYLGIQLAYEYMEMGVGTQNYDEYAVPYGTKQIRYPGLGSVTEEQKIIIGEWKGEEEGYVFPGVKGYSFFPLEVEGENGEGGYVRWNNGMFDGHLTVHGFEGYTLEGTVYFGPELEDDPDKIYHWRPYPVYQMEDGTVYLLLEGSASYGPKGGMTITEKRETTTTFNGKKRSQSLEISYKMDWAERVTAVEVRQFDKNDVLVSRERISIADAGDRLEGMLHPEADWLIVQEITEYGAGEKVVYAMDDKLHDGSIRHSLILLDEDGMGYRAKLVLK